MKVFISWSGDVSHTVGVALREWLPSVLQSVEPYVSSEDIEKGARWTAEIGRQLDDTSFGILCVTRQNLDSPWLNFEAGALSKSIDSSHVSPFLLDIRPAELVGPLSQFQATLPRLDDVIRLVKSINAASERPIEEARLADAAEMWWPRLEKELKAALTKQDQGQLEPQRDTKEMIEEVLEITRGIQRQLVRNEAEELELSGDRPYPSRTVADRRLRLAKKTLDSILAEAGIENWTANLNRDGLEVHFLALPPEALFSDLLSEISNRYSVPLSITVQNSPSTKILISPDEPA